jgi:hypothetical protein
VIRELTADVSVLEQRLTSTGAVDETSLLRPATIAVTAWASAGERRHAHRWWRTAHQSAVAPRDLETRMWVSGWDVVNGLYEHRPAARQVRRLARERVEASAFPPDRGIPG